MSLRSGVFIWHSLLPLPACVGPFASPWRVILFLYGRNGNSGLPVSALLWPVQIGERDENRPECPRPDKHRMLWATRPRTKPDGDNAQRPRVEPVIQRQHVSRKCHDVILPTLHHTPIPPRVNSFLSYVVPSTLTSPNGAP